MKFYNKIFVYGVALGAALSVTMQALHAMQNYNQAEVAQALEEAIENNALDTAKSIILTYKDKFDLNANIAPDLEEFYYTLLHYAVLIDNPTFVTLLLESGANPTIQNSFGDIPLHCIQKISPHSVQLAQMLIKAGSALNTQNNQGDTPLHKAASRYNLSVVQLLLTLCDKYILIKNKAGYTALDIAKTLSAQTLHEQETKQQLVTLLTFFSTTLKQLSLDCIRKHKKHEDKLLQLHLELQEELGYFQTL